MQFLDFKQELSKYLVFSIKDIEKLYPNFNKINLLYWQKKGYIQKIRNSWYFFTDIKIDETVLFYISNKIYSPSYVSLESALYYYGIIPEAVFSINSITTLKTNKFKSYTYPINYSSIKPSCFFGYKLLKNEKYTFKVAEIEKALLDYLYLQVKIKSYKDIKSLRFNKHVLQEKLNMQKLFDYASLYNSKVLLKKINILKQLLDD